MSIKPSHERLSDPRARNEQGACPDPQFYCSQEPTPRRKKGNCSRDQEVAAKEIAARTSKLQLRKSQPGPGI